MRGWTRLGLSLALGLVGIVPVFADRPHLDYTTVTKTATGSGAATDTTLWDPESGKRFFLLGAMVCARNAAITVELEVSDVDVVPPIRFESTGCQVVEAGGGILYESVTDAILTYTVTGSGSWSVLTWGYEAQ